MSLEELLQEKKEVEDQLRHWQSALQEAENTLAATRQQVFVGIGHLERLNTWISKLRKQQKEQEEKSSEV